MFRPSKKYPTHDTVPLKTPMDLARLFWQIFSRVLTQPSTEEDMAKIDQCYGREVNKGFCS